MQVGVQDREPIPPIPDSDEHECISPDPQLTTGRVGGGGRRLDVEVAAEPDLSGDRVREPVFLNGVEERLAAADPDLIVQLLQRAYRLKLLPLSFNALWLKYDVPKQRDRHSFGLALVQRSKGRKKLPPTPTGL